MLKICYFALLTKLMWDSDLMINIFACHCLIITARVTKDNKRQNNVTVLLQRVGIVHVV